MKDRQRITTTERAALRLGELFAKLDAVEEGTTLVGRIRDATAGTQAQRFDAQRSGPSVPDPTFVAAVRGIDPASRDLAELDRLVGRIDAAVAEAWHIVDRYPPPRFATASDRLALGRANARAEPGCENCSRIEGPRGGPRWEPIHPKLRDATDVDGRLDRPRLLCRWCWDKVVLWGRMPSATELQTHHRGDRVPWPNDVERPA